MYPQRVDINPESIKKLTRLYKDTYKQILDEITNATSFSGDRKRQILRQIDKILRDLGTDVDKFIKEEIPQYYKQGAEQAVKQLNNVGADIPVDTGFNLVQKEYIMGLVDDVSTAFGETLSTVKRTTSNLLGRAVRDAVTQKIAKGITAGDALKQVRDQIVLQLKEQGLTALVDKGGRAWELDTYAEMLFRTKVVEARNRGMVNRMVENGYDLVQVSAHGADDVCGDWEGEILSMTGKTPGYKTVAEAEADGLFHPNCKHALNVMIPKLARQTNAYDTEEQ